MNRQIAAIQAASRLGRPVPPIVELKDPPDFNGVLALQQAGYTRGDKRGTWVSRQYVNKVRSQLLALRDRLPRPGAK